MKLLKLGLVGAITIIVIGIVWKYGTKGKVSGVYTGPPGTYEIEVPERISSTDPFVIKLNVDTKGQSINAVGLHLKFATNRLQILNMDTTKSFCELYPENRYDNQTGEIKISCGLPSPGFNGQGTLAVITFEPLSVGTTELQVLEDSAILLNDGKATNILKEYPIRDVLIVGNL